MNISITELIKDLSTYSPLANTAAENLAAALRPVAYTILTLFFAIELLEQAVDTRLEGGALTPRIVGTIVFNYALAYLLILNSTVLLQAILYAANALASLGDKAITQKSISMAIELGQIKGVFFKNIMKFFAVIVEYLGQIVTQILLMMRYYQMYIAKALAPIIVALFVNRTLRSVAVNFLKLFAAYALQGLVLLIIIRLFPFIITDSLVKANVGLMPSIGAALAGITKGFIYIIVLIGSGRYIKQILGVS